jgi:iron complex outermembrane recepter protein
MHDGSRWSLQVAGVAAGTVLGACLGATAEAQTQLPGIVVATPSPVSRPPPPTQAQAPAAGAEAPPATAPILADDQFVALTVVPSREIAATDGQNLADSLQYKPGITGSTFAPGANRPIIRGLDSYRVRMQENGIGAHDVSALSEDHAVPIDPFSADRIEVVRGPATLRYGSQAIGGVVNATNDRIPEAIPRAGFRAQYMGGLASVDASADSAFKVTAGAGNFAVHADAFRRRAEDYDTPAGRQFNSFADSDGYSVGASHVWRDGFIGVAYVNFNSLYGIPGAGAAEEKVRIDLQQDKIVSRGEWRVRDHGIEAIRYWFGASAYAHDEVGLATGVPEVGSRFTNREQEGRIEVQHLPAMTRFGELRGAVGLQLGHRNVRGQSFEGDSLLEPTQTSSAAAFWFEELQVTRLLRLQAATRLEHTQVDGSGLDLAGPALPALLAAQRTFTPFSASAGVLYELPHKVVARLTAQYVERSPADAELFSKGVHEATGTFEIGRPFLDIEAARTIEIGLKRAAGAFRFDASAYYTAFDGFIFKQRTGQTCGDTLASCTPGGPGGELNQILFQQRDAVFYGAELSAQLDIGRIHRGTWGIDGQYDFVRAVFDDARDGNVPRMPPHRLGFGLYYRDANLYARTGFLHAFDQNEIGEHETPTKGYTLLSADLAYTFKLPPHAAVVPEMTVGLKGENLLDDDVRNSASFKKDEVLQPGRNVRLYGIVRLN